jgi:hypothetical protein
LTRQEHVQQDAQRIDVGGGRDRAPLHLLRAGVQRRHQSQARRRRLDAGGQQRALEELGDAEVEQARHAVGGDQDVRRLDVAMHHQVLMRVLHRGTDLAEEVDPGIDSETMAVAVLVDGLPADVLHDEVGPPVVGVAAVQESRDPGVVERGQDLAFGAEPCREVGAVRSVGQDLEGDLLLVDVVGAHRDVHRAHAALAEHGLHRVVADPPADERRRRGRRGLRGNGGLPEEFARPLVGDEQRLDLASHLEILATLARQEGRPFARSQRGRLIEELLDAPPAIRRNH